MNRLQDKVVIVTGAGRGIGEATAVRCAAEGACVTLAARSTQELEAVARRITEAGGSAAVCPTDVTNPAQVERLVQSTVDAHHRVDALVHAAGVYGPIGATWEVDPQKWMRGVEVNLFGTLILCQAVARQMIKARSGKIVTFSGGGATAPLPRFSSYAASKAALVRLTETLAEELKPFNVQVNAIAPGAVNTRLQDEVLAAGENAGELLGRIQRLRQSGEGGTPVEVPAALAVFLTSEQSGALTGRLISAPHDGWQQWDDARIAELMSQPWFTLRRMDPFTLKPLLERMQQSAGDGRGK